MDSLVFEKKNQEENRIAGEIARLVREGRATPRDVAVFYRVNAQSRVLEAALGWPGLGYLAWRAAAARDMPVLLGSNSAEKPIT